MSLTQSQLFCCTKSLSVCLTICLSVLRFVHLVCDTLGFDWLLLFLQTQVHLDTVVRALRMLVLLLSDPSLRKRFVVGDIFGGWLSGMQNTLPEYTKERQRHLHFSLSSSHRPDIQLQGILCLARLLPNHLESAQTFHLVIALMLGVSVTEVPYTAGLDLESLDSIFGVGRSTKGSRLASGNMCLEAVFILLSMVRVLLHQVMPLLPHTITTSLRYCYCRTVAMVTERHSCCSNSWSRSTTMCPSFSHRCVAVVALQQEV